MRSFVLKRKHPQAILGSELARYADRGVVCNIVWVDAESEAQARELASTPADLERREIVYRGMARGSGPDLLFDDEPHVWLDPELTEIEEIKGKTRDAPCVTLRQFGQVGVGEREVNND